MSRKMHLGEIAASVGSQLASADAVLRSSQSQLRLTGLALRLQGAAAIVDNSVGLDFSAPAGGSAMDFSFHAAGGATNPGEPVAVPDVRGYTPALARRKLQAVGLSIAMTTIANATGRDGGKTPIHPGSAGRVSEQQPPPGAQALPGTLVQVIVR
ncbi:PASTA domain-containing protein [Sorangium sp. So ce426]|uniref:PASTA domain-containing protein n=1 Tax=Sorangium sp. So ce426 TaxID=3133312 RepID=UPI003F5B257A